MAFILYEENFSKKLLTQSGDEDLNFGFYVSMSVGNALFNVYTLTLKNSAFSPKLLFIKKTVVAKKIF